MGPIATPRWNSIVRVPHSCKQQQPLASVACIISESRRLLLIRSEFRSSMPGGGGCLLLASTSL